MRRFACDVCYVDTADVSLFPSVVRSLWGLLVLDSVGCVCSRCGDA